MGGWAVKHLRFFFLPFFVLLHGSAVDQSTVARDKARLVYTLKGFCQASFQAACCMTFLSVSAEGEQH